MVLFSPVNFTPVDSDGIDVSFFYWLVDLVWFGLRESERNHRTEGGDQTQPWVSYMAKQHSGQVNFFDLHVPFDFHGHFQTRQH